MYYKCLKDIVSFFLPHPNQNSPDFPCFELRAKMTSLSKILEVNSAKNSDMFTSIPTPITKSLEKLLFAYVYQDYVTGSVGLEVKKKISNRSVYSTTIKLLEKNYVCFTVQNRFSDIYLRCHSIEL